MQVILAGTAHRPEDFGAAVRLAPDQQRVVALFGPSVEFVSKFRADQLDGGKGRSQLMRRRGDDPAKVGQLLFAGKRHLRSKQGPAHRPDLGRDAAGVDRQEAYPDDDGQPVAYAEDRGGRQNRAAGGTQGKVIERDKGDEGDGHKRDRPAGPWAENRGANCRRGEDQEGERICQPPCQSQKKCQLRGVEKEACHRLPFGQTLGFRKDADRSHVCRNRNADNKKTWTKRHGKR